MFLDFRDLNQRISTIINSGTVNGFREIGSSMSRIINTALSCQPKAINSYNKVSQGLIIDGAYQDITPEHLKAIASANVMSAEQSIIEDIRLLDADINRFSSESVTTPLNLGSLSKDGTIQALNDGFLIFNNELYINPAIWHAISGNQARASAAIGSDVFFWPDGTVPMSRQVTSPYDCYGIYRISKSCALLIKGMLAGAETYSNSVSIIVDSPTWSSGWVITAKYPSNLRLGTARNQAGGCSFLITDLSGNVITTDTWIKVIWGVTQTITTPGGGLTIDGILPDISQIPGDSKKSIGPAIVPMNDAIRSAISYDEFASLPPLLHNAL